MARGWWLWPQADGHLWVHGVSEHRWIARRHADQAQGLMQLVLRRAVDYDWADVIRVGPRATAPSVRRLLLDYPRLAMRVVEWTTAAERMYVVCQAARDEDYRPQPRRRAAAITGR